VRMLDTRYRADSDAAILVCGGETHWFLEKVSVLGPDTAFELQDICVRKNTRDRRLGTEDLGPGRCVV
jgi:hypothetical protein